MGVCCTYDVSFVPMTSLTSMECCTVRGVLEPAALMALTRTRILTIDGSPVMVYLVLSVGSLLVDTHSSAVDQTRTSRAADNASFDHNITISLYFVTS